MKISIWSVIAILTWGVCLNAAPVMQFGLNMGVESPQDATVRQTFGSNFALNGTAAYVMDSGLVLRGALGFYSDTSHNPADGGQNFRLDITQLNASILMNWNLESPFFRPYLGAGVGAAFYTARDDAFGELESGTRFGPHLIAGSQVALSHGVFGSIEYRQQILSPIFFNHSNHFNTWALTLGVGVSVPTERPAPSVSTPVSDPYPYTRAEEELLIKIQQLRTEISEMTRQRLELQTQIDQFYKTSTYNEKSAKFLKQLEVNKFSEGKVAALTRSIDAATKELTQLESEWQRRHPRQAVVEKEIIYLDTHYHRSPWGVRRSHGYLYYGYAPYEYRYYAPTIIVNQVSSENASSKSPSEIQKEREDYLQKKKEHINELKNR